MYALQFKSLEHLLVFERNKLEEEEEEKRNIIVIIFILKI